MKEINNYFSIILVITYNIHFFLLEAINSFNFLFTIKCSFSDLFNFCNNLILYENYVLPIL